MHAVDGVSFELGRGEMLALAGESGCGKSTLALTLMGLETPTAGQHPSSNGQDVTHPDRRRDQKQLRRCIQMVFQDPYELLNPLMTVERDRGRAAGGASDWRQQAGAPGAGRRRRWKMPG